MSIKDQLIATGVKNLKTYGYPDCNSKNILTDSIYGQFFKSMLMDNKGHGFDETIDGLIAEIDKSS